jgi:hypothetical protein
MPAHYGLHYSCCTYYEIFPKNVKWFCPDRKNWTSSFKIFRGVSVLNVLNYVFGFFIKEVTLLYISDINKHVLKEHSKAFPVIIAEASKILSMVRKINVTYILNFFSS